MKPVLRLCLSGILAMRQPSKNLGSSWISSALWNMPCYAKSTDLKKVKQPVRKPTKAQASCSLKLKRAPNNSLNYQKRSRRKWTTNEEIQDLRTYASRRPSCLHSVSSRTKWNWMGEDWSWNLPFPKKKQTTLKHNKHWISKTKSKKRTKGT